MKRVIGGARTPTKVPVPSLHEVIEDLRGMIQQVHDHHCHDPKEHRKRGENQKKVDRGIVSAIRDKYRLAEDAAKRILKVTSLRHSHHSTYVNRYQRLWIFSGELLFRKAKAKTGGSLSLRVLREFSVDDKLEQYMHEKGNANAASSPAITFSIEARLRIVECFLVLAGFACTATGWLVMCETSQEQEQVFSRFLSRLDWTSATFLESHEQLRAESVQAVMKEAWGMVVKVIEHGTSQLVSKHGQKRKVRLHDRPVSGNYAESLIPEISAEEMVPFWVLRMTKFLLENHCRKLPGNKYELTVKAVECYKHVLDCELGHLEEPVAMGTQRDDMLREEMLVEFLPDYSDIEEEEEKNPTRKEKTKAVVTIDHDGKQEAKNRAKKRSRTENSPKNGESSVAEASERFDVDSTTARKEVPVAAGIAAAVDIEMTNTLRKRKRIGSYEHIEESILDELPSEETGHTMLVDDNCGIPAKGHKTTICSNTAAVPNTSEQQNPSSSTLGTFILSESANALPKPSPCSSGEPSRAEPVLITHKPESQLRSEPQQAKNPCREADKQPPSAYPIQNFCQDQSKAQGEKSSLSVGQDVDRDETEDGGDGDGDGDGDENEDEDENENLSIPPGFPRYGLWLPKAPNKDVQQNVFCLQDEFIHEVLIWDVCLGRSHGTWLQHFANSYKKEALDAYNELYTLGTVQKHGTAIANATANAGEPEEQSTQDKVERYSKMWRYLYFFEVRVTLVEEMRKTQPIWDSEQGLRTHFKQVFEKEPNNRYPPYSLCVKSFQRSVREDVITVKCEVELDNPDESCYLEEFCGSYLCMCRFQSSDNNDHARFCLSVSSQTWTGDDKEQMRTVHLSRSTLRKIQVNLSEGSRFELVFCNPITQYIRTYAGVRNAHFLPARLQSAIIAARQIGESEMSAAPAATPAASIPPCITQMDSDSENYLNELLSRQLVNQSQHNALKRVFMQIGDLSQPRSSLSLIQGPPGAGKTQCVIALIGGLLANRSNPSPVSDIDDGILRRGNLKKHDMSRRRAGISIAVLASSNTAVDLIMERVHCNGIPWGGAGQRVIMPQMIPIGRPNFKLGFAGGEQYMIQNKVHRYWQGRLEQGVEKGSFTYRLRAVADESILCFSTVAACTSVAFNQLRKEFDVVIIDEVSRIQDPEICAAFMATKMHNPKSKEIRCVLVGDHKQLGLLPKALHLFQTYMGVLRLPRNHAATHFEERLLDVSTFERLQSCASSTCPAPMLKIQYRMSPRFSWIHSRLFYDGNISNGLPSSHFQQKYSLNGASLTWIDTSLDRRNTEVFHELRHRPGAYLNLYEVEIVRLILGNLTLYLKNVLKQNESEWPGISVVTPYRVQLSCFEEEVRRRSEYYESPFNYKKLTLSAVDSMQGKVDDIVIISCVRADRYSTRRRGNGGRTQMAGGLGARLGFLADEKRLNVLFSRARYALILVGHAPTLTNSGFPYWRDYYEFCKDPRDTCSIVENPNDQTGWSSREPWFRNVRRM